MFWQATRVQFSPFTQFIIGSHNTANKNSEDFGFAFDSVPDSNSMFVGDNGIKSREQKKEIQNDTNVIRYFNLRMNFDAMNRLVVACGWEIPSPHLKFQQNDNKRDSKFWKHFVEA